MIEPEKRGSGSTTEYRWTCSLCGKVGPWEKDHLKVLDDGEKHAKDEHAQNEREGN